MTNVWHILPAATCIVLSASAPLHAQAPAHGQRPATGASSRVAAAVPNDNRVPGGRMAGGVLEVHLVARATAWRPDLDVDSAVTVQAFAEVAGAPRIPGPLLRAAEGTQIRATVTNDVADSTLIVHGLRAGTVRDDTLHVRPGSTREVRFRAGAAGTYLYWGTTSGKMSPGDRGGRDGQLTGALVIDAVGTVPDPDERIFVITVIDIVPDTTRPPPHEDIWELGINGMAWPHSERLEYPVGDTVRWRWLNGSYLPHPMHLHGFHFRVLSKGNGVADSRVPADEIRHVVTEFMAPGSTFSMEWTPTRAGNWLFHCHMAPHITPYPARADSLMAHDLHDVAQHALRGMAGLVLGVRSVDRATTAALPSRAPSQHLRLFAQQAPRTADPRLRAAALVLQGDMREPRRDSVSVPGQPLVLRRGETTAITVINRTEEPTTVHWHGMELESLYDGVAGWSGLGGAGGSVAPLLAPADSFVVSFTPPRAGTYIYHTHMDEGSQLTNGMYGAMLVLEPGERYDPATDLLMIMGRAVDGGANKPALNGRHTPPPLSLKAGTTYRIRVINILPAEPIEIRLMQDTTLLTWIPIAKDGAALPVRLRTSEAATVKRVGVGETYDFEWTPTGPLDAVLQMRLGRTEEVVTQTIRVR